MSRRLTLEERELWERLGRTVRPLRRHRAKRSFEDSAALAVEPQPKPQSSTKASSRLAPAALPTPARELGLAALDEKTRRRLTRGLVAIDARIDLHGMRQERAFAALASFLKQAQARGDRIVLVITGKGAGAGGEGRGVLRHAVPAWLERPDFRELASGFEEAGRRHGGAGALYIRVRRRRAPGRAGAPA